MHANVERRRGSVTGTASRPSPPRLDDAGSTTAQSSNKVLCEEHGSYRNELLLSIDACDWQGVEERSPTTFRNLM